MTSREEEAYELYPVKQRKTSPVNRATSLREHKREMMRVQPGSPRPRRTPIKQKGIGEEPYLKKRKA